MYFNLRLVRMTRGMRLRILLAALVGLAAVAAGIARLAISGVVIAQVFQGVEFSTLLAPLAAVAGLIVLRVASFSTSGTSSAITRQRPSRSSSEDAFTPTPSRWGRVTSTSNAQATH